MKAIDAYARALASASDRWLLRGEDGTVIPLRVDRWLDPPCEVENRILDRLSAPVLDVGCGPGRHVVALAQRGVLCLGVDVSREAVALARARGAPVHEGSVFDGIPAPGRWGSALLLDGNVGIGGAPEALLARLNELLEPGGAAWVEVDPPGRTGAAGRVRLEGPGVRSRSFHWATVSIAEVPGLARRSNFRLAGGLTGGGRWFVRLVSR